MKIILSRKGFDGSNGGMPSPIMPDGTLLSMPIRSDDAPTYCDMEYRFQGQGHTYYDILNDLRPDFSKGRCHASPNGSCPIFFKGRCPKEKVKEHCPFFYRGHCHVDPDLDPSRHVDEIPNWVPAFGQVDAAQGYLEKSVEIKEGDLFLFFGNFHFVEEVEGHFRFVKSDTDFYKCNDIQIIWGYMQVDKIVKNPEEIKRFSWHPHSDPRRIDDSSNTIYVGRPKLKGLKGLPGYGCLPFHEKRVLTKKVQKMEEYKKATWEYNPVYAPDAIIGDRKNSSENGGIYYQGIWQELGLKETEEAEKWALGMIS